MTVEILRKNLEVFASMVYAIYRPYCGDGYMIISMMPLENGIKLKDYIKIRIYIFIKNPFGAYCRGFVVKTSFYSLLCMSKCS